MARVQLAAPLQSIALLQPVEEENSAHTKAEISQVNEPVTDLSPDQSEPRHTADQVNNSNDLDPNSDAIFAHKGSQQGYFGWWQLLLMIVLNELYSLHFVLGWLVLVVGSGQGFRSQFVIFVVKEII